MLAIVSDRTRAAELSAITCPTLVLHGKADPLVPYAHGDDTAKRIAGAQLVGFEGLGHDLPPGLYDTVIDAIVAAATRAKANA